MLRATVSYGMAVLLSMTATSQATASGKPAIPESVRQNVRQRVDHGPPTGIVVALVDANGVAYFSHGHFAGGEGSPAVGENTVFEIGSITKVFTTIAMCSLAEQGKLALDDPVSKFLPEGVTAPQRKGKPITLQDLATHRSGLPRMPTNFFPCDVNDPYATYSPERLYTFLSGHKLRRDIGSKYEYSNLGMGLLGHLLGLATGKPYEQVIIDEICQPLGLDDTRTELSDEQKQRLATGHAGPNEAPHWNDNALAGCGALYSTAADMVKFMLANMGLQESKISSSLRRSHEGRQATDDSNMFVALGWHIWTHHDTTIIWHNGGTGGFRSFAGFRPDTKQGVVVLANSTDSVDLVGLHLLEPKYRLDEVANVVEVAPELLEAYRGFYELQPEVYFQVTHQNGRLIAQLTGQAALPLEAKSPHVFVYKDVEAQLTFEWQDDKVTGLVLLQNNTEQRARKMPPDFRPPPPKARVEVEVSPKVLAGYVGNYKLDRSMAFDVTLDGNQLMVQLTGQPAFPVFAESETEFFYKIVDAQITFVPGESGKARALVLHQSGQQLRAERIE